VQDHCDATRDDIRDIRLLQGGGDVVKKGHDTSVGWASCLNARHDIFATKPP
jgi:hypothetical protein